MKKVVIGPKDWRWLAVWLTVIVGGLLVSSVVVRETNRSHLEAEGERAALLHIQTLQAAVPGLFELLSQGKVNDKVVSDLKRFRSLGDVYRYKLYEPSGAQLLDSDELDVAHLGKDGAQLGDHHGADSQELQEAVLAGRPVVELVQGGGKVGEPELYSEAYVPVFSDGRFVGVMEAYVNQVEQASRIAASLSRIAFIVGGMLLLLAGLGCMHWLQRMHDQRQAEERVRYLAKHDVLSGALNRASFREALDAAIWRQQESGEGFAVLCLDLDRFKEVNDSLGHAAGDEVLRQVTQRLRDLVRHGDELARLGGDEFAVLQHGVSDASAVTTLAQKVVDVLAAPYEIAGRRLLVGASVGASIFGVDANNAEDLMHRADVALYRAKGSGRGTFSFYDAELDAQLRSRHELCADLRLAIADEALTLDYQPLYSQDGTAITGYEALLRWQHPKRGDVPPSEFIPLAEDVGLIETLGTWVLRRACQDANKWPGNLTVAVNLSAAQFKHGDLLGTVVGALADSGLAATRLELEITESLLMNDTDKVIQVLTALGAMGVRIAMDDFGTGYSSLAYLWRFPFDKVKIDRAFTQGLADDPKVSVIVRSIISLAHSLRIKVNAEGIETESQMQALREHGCDELQGFWLGRPTPASALLHGGQEGVPVKPVGHEFSPSQAAALGDVETPQNTLQS